MATPSNPIQHSTKGIKLFQGIVPLKRGGAIRDAIAGIELAAMNIPQALGYTRIAGTPLVTGFYTLLLPLAAFAVFGSSRFLVVAADSATAAILAGGISTLAPVGSAHYLALASGVALLTAVLLLIARLLRLGFLADFLSQTVLVGFLTGVGIQVGIAVLGEMLGIETESHRTVFQLGEVLRGLPEIHGRTIALSGVAVAVVFLCQKFAPRVPGPFVVVAGAIAASAAFDFGGRGIAVIGTVPGGLPGLAFPRLTWGEIQALLPIAVSCFVMIVAQSAATARSFAVRHGQAEDENTDLVGLAAANAAAAVTGTFVVNGSPTQTAMVESAGARSQLAQVATSGVVAVVLLFFTKPVELLPRCVLGAIVFTIAVRLIDLRGLAAILKESPGEFTLAIFTAGVVVLVGVQQGIVLAMVVSLLRVVHHSYRPHTAVLRPGEHGIWQITPVVPGAETRPGLVVYRFGAPLFYANAARFADQLRELVYTAKEPVKWVLIDTGAITNLDYTAARVVQHLHADLTKRNVIVLLAHVEPSLQSDLNRHGLTPVIGADRIFDSIHEALDSIASSGGERR